MTNGIDESSVRGQGIKIGLIMVLLVAAGFITYAQTRTDIKQPDTPESATTYVCIECNQAFDLTPAQYCELCESGGFQAGEDHMRGSVYLRCPHCGQFGGIRGIRCPADGTPIPRITKDGKPGRCPKCGYSPVGR